MNADWFGWAMTLVVGAVPLRWCRSGLKSPRGHGHWMRTAGRLVGVTHSRCNGSHREVDSWSVVAKEREKSRQVLDYVSIARAIFSRQHCRIVVEISSKRCNLPRSDPLASLFGTFLLISNVNRSSVSSDWSSRTRHTHLSLLHLSKFYPR